MSFSDCSPPRWVLLVQGPCFEKHQSRALARWSDGGGRGHNWPSEAPVGSWPLPGVPTLEDVWPVTGTGHCGLHGPAGHHSALPGRSVHMEHGTRNPAPGEAGGTARCLPCTRILRAQVALSLHLRGQMRAWPEAGPGRADSEQAEVSLQKPPRQEGQPGAHGLPALGRCASAD